MAPPDTSASAPGPTRVRRAWRGKGQGLDQAERSITWDWRRTSAASCGKSWTAARGVSAALQEGREFGGEPRSFGTGLLSFGGRITGLPVYWVEIASLRAPDRGRAGCIGRIGGTIHPDEPPQAGGGPGVAAPWPVTKCTDAGAGLAAAADPMSARAGSACRIRFSCWRRRLFSRPRSLAACRRFDSRRPCHRQLKTAHFLRKGCPSWERFFPGVSPRSERRSVARHAALPCCAFRPEPVLPSRSRCSRIR